MKRLNSVLIMVLFIGSLFGQIITLSHNEVSLGQVNIDTESNRTLTITNNEADDVLINIVENSNVISFDQVSLTIPGNQSSTVTLSFIPETNIVYDYTVFFNVDSEKFTVPLKVIASGRIPNSNYDETYNKWDSELTTELKAIIANHHSISYVDARIELFGYIANVNEQVRCVYTNEWYYCPYGGIPDWNQINTEHTWPQSVGATGIAKSDLHHLFPTNSRVNSIRGNSPFGDVVNATWQEHGSKKGSNSAGNVVFEPRDDHKGDTARVMFYFALRYNNPNNYLDLSGQQMALRNWYYQDPVSQYEIERNEEIEAIQNKPNPFIEYPQLLDRVANLTHNVTTPRFPLAYIPFTEYDFPQTELNGTSQISIPIANGGDNTLAISSIMFDDPAFSITDFPTNLEIGDWGVITVNFSPTAEEQYSSNMLIYSNATELSISLQGSGGSVPNSDHEVELFTNLSLINYPNPFAEQTTLAIRGIKQNSASIAIYNVKGQKVTTITNSNLRGGLGELTWDGKDSRGKKLPAGLYFAKLSSGKQSATRKILIMK